MKPASVIALLSALCATPAWAQAGPWPSHMHDWGLGWGGGMVLGPLLTIALLVALAVVLFRWLGSGGGGTRTRAARDVLDERYARGEIDREEYLRRRQDISGE